MKTTITDVFDEAKKYYEQRKYETAFPILKLLAEQGNVEAQFYLARMYNNAEGVEYDNEQGWFWVHKAAEQGHIDAQHSLGYSHFLKFITKNEDSDLNLAVFWYQKAAEQGNVVAQLKLGDLYSRKILDTSRNDEKAVFWYRKAAEQGNAQAQYEIAKIYMDIEPRYMFEVGIPQDFDQASFWFHKAAEQGHAEAQYHLGFFYRYGKGGVAKNYLRAEYWYKKAAKQGNVDAVIQLNKRGKWWLGNLLLNSNGTLPNSTNDKYDTFPFGS